jgi:hypothetical protein
MWNRLLNVTRKETENRELNYMCNDSHENWHVTFSQVLSCDMQAIISCLKLKLSHYMPWRYLGGEEYSSYSFLTLALDGGEWSVSRPGRALVPAEGPPVPIRQETGRAPQPIWAQKLEKNFFGICQGSNLDCLVIQPIARHYTDWDTRLTHYYLPPLYFFRARQVQFGCSRNSLYL